MPYDHAEKCGNEGDVVKHVALLAALDTVLASFRGPLFRYADLFAGYAECVLAEDGAWRRGVGRVASEAALDANPHAAGWRRYVSGPSLAGRAYPGSSRIAVDVARRRGVPLHLALWDVSAPAVASLRAAWGDAATVFERPAAPEEPAVAGADFLFVDPPDLAAVEATRPALAPARTGGALVWLPVLRDVGLPPDPAGHDALEVSWPRAAGRTVACRLLHRLPPPAARALDDAVRHVAAVAGWTVAC